MVFKSGEVDRKIIEASAKSRRKIFDERPLCSHDDCNNLARKLYKRIDGSWSFGKNCIKHHNMKYGYGSNASVKKCLRRRLEKHGCSICGWNEASCDLHRIVWGKDGGEYTTNNVIVLCPNCHRLVHVGKIKLSAKPISQGVIN